MYYLFSFILCFIIVYLIYTLLITMRKKGLEKLKTGRQMHYFKTLYNLDENKLDIKKFAGSLALTNSLIISITFTVIIAFKSLLLGLIVGLIIIIPLMYISYKILGQTYKKKEGK